MHARAMTHSYHESHIYVHGALTCVSPVRLLNFGVCPPLSYPLLCRSLSRDLFLALSRSLALALALPLALALALLLLISLSLSLSCSGACVLCSFPFRSCHHFPVPPQPTPPLSLPLLPDPWERCILSQLLANLARSQVNHKMRAQIWEAKG